MSHVLATSPRRRSTRCRRTSGTSASRAGRWAPTTRPSGARTTAAAAPSTRTRARAETPGPNLPEGARRRVNVGGRPGRPVYSDCGATVLANYQQVKISGPPNLSEPIGFDQLPDGRVIQTDRRGGVRLHNPATGTTRSSPTSPTRACREAAVYTNSEDGMYGPGRRQQLRDEPLGLPLLRPADRRQHHLLRRDDGPHERLLGRAVPNGSAPTTGASPSVWDSVDRLLPALAVQVRRRRPGHAGAPRPRERAADHARPEQARRVLPRRG